MNNLFLDPNYILTYSDIKMNPIDPKPEDISINDIAHALSFMSRANGHIKSFFSVAQHSICCCLEAKARGYSKRIQLLLLLHDASEAYIADIIRPVKRNLDKYIEVEKVLQDVIYKAFDIDNISEDEHIIIKEIDNIMLQNEFVNLMNRKIFIEEMPCEIQHDFSCRDFKEVENQFIKLFNDLI